MAGSPADRRTRLPALRCHVPHELPDWQPGDRVYGLAIDPATGRYRVRGVGRVVSIEAGKLHLATTKGPRTWGATEWPAFKSREAGEAYLREKSRPGLNNGPMAHHTEPVTSSSWECGRCENIREGLAPPAWAPEHSPRCPYRGTSRDPEHRG